MALWRVDEAAEYLGIRPKTLYEWVRADRVPYRKIGFNVRFDPDELKAWTAAQAQGPAPRGTDPAGSGDEGRSAAEDGAASPAATAALCETASEAAEVLRRLRRDLGAHLSYPQRQRLDELAERLEQAADDAAT